MDVFGVLAGITLASNMWRVDPSVLSHTRGVSLDLIAACKARSQKNVHRMREM